MPEQRTGVEIALGRRQRMMTQEVSAAHSFGHGPAEASQQAARRRGKESCLSLPLLHDVFLVSAKQLVSAVSRQHDLHALSRQLRNHIGRYGGAIAEWLVEMPGEVFQLVERVRTQRQFVVVGGELRGYQRGVTEFVVVGLFESDRKCLQRRRAYFC